MEKEEKVSSSPLSSLSISQSTTVGWRMAKDGRIHRKRRIEYPNGDEYNGEVVNGRRDGVGKLQTSKYTYVGSFRHGLFDGRGTFTWCNFKEDDIDIVGRKFVGVFQKGKRNGEGVLYDGKGGTWEGTWKDDVFHGKGRIRKADGELLEGFFVNGKLHCDDGHICFSNGDIYQGGVHFGILHSEVAHISYGYDNNSSYYTGQFHYNTKHGIGIRLFIDGSTYRGNFLNNNINGQGTMHYADNSRTLKHYSGEWKDGVFHGMGELRFQANCDIESYKGEFRNGLYHGHGKLLYRDGGYYEGEFKNSTITGTEDRFLTQTSPFTGTKHGQGRRVWASGNTFEGTWDNDQMIEGKYFDKTHCSTYAGTFVNNKKCGPSGREIWRSTSSRIDDKLSSFRDPCLKWKHKGDETCKYVGEYKSGYFHGRGIFSCSDGREYDGEWKFGKQHGYGVATLLAKYQIGDPKRMYIGKYGSLYKPIKYEGEWENGVQHGNGKFTFLDGSEKRGEFVYGHLKEEYRYCN